MGRGVVKTQLGSVDRSGGRRRTRARGGGGVDGRNRVMTREMGPDRLGQRGVD